MKNVLFKIDLDEGKLAGTGHFFRCLKIYKIIKKKYNKKLNFYFLFKNYKNSKKIINKYIKKNIIIYDKKFKEKISFLRKDDLIINDTPKKIDKEFLSFCEKKPIKNLILIDHDEIKFKHKYIIINGIFYFKKILKKKKNIFQGLNYILLDKKFSSINFVNKPKNNKFKVLATTGGTDNKNILIKIYNCLKNLPNINFYFIVGPGFKKNNPINKLRKKNIFLIKNKIDLTKYYKIADLSITAGGISMFESVLTKKITLVTELYQNQKYSIQFLKKLGIIFVIGKRNIIFRKKLFNIVKKYIKEKNNKGFNYHKKLNLIDGKSIFRIEKIIHKVINSNENQIK